MTQLRFRSLIPLHRMRNSVINVINTKYTMQPSCHILITIPFSALRYSYMTILDFTVLRPNSVGFLLIWYIYRLDTRTQSIYHNMKCFRTLLCRPDLTFYKLTSYLTQCCITQQPNSFKYTKKITFNTLLEHVRCLFIRRKRMKTKLKWEFVILIQSVSLQHQVTM